ncbi:hypothetical protein [Streptomyces sp. CAU 1734]|uniref:hypothetical protein n=1 Tax=Streptomyces sp. CAU 1734 TaxID=3140360 RepID=UPI0032610092
MAAGTAVVSAITAEAWAEARQAVIGLWQRFTPQGRTESIALALDEDARAIEAAAADTPADDRVALRREQLAEDWQNNFRMLLRDHPEAREAVIALVRDELAPRIPEERQREQIINRITHVTVHSVTVRDEGRSVVAGGDVTENHRG